MDECKPLPCGCLPPQRQTFEVEPRRGAPPGQGHTFAHFIAQLEDLRDLSLTLQLNLSTFGTHPRVRLGYMGDD